MSLSQNEIKIIVEKLVRKMLGDFGEHLLGMSENNEIIKRRDAIAITESVATSFLANLLKLIQKDLKGEIDMKVFLDRLHESLKFHLLENHNGKI